ncbi:MAG: hypothetical protein PUD56_08030 [Prevotella sp.]|nr:hypothetical protein [Prevotella sp.]
MQLRNKIEAFRSATKTRSALHLTMITTYGIQRNTHSGIMQSEVTMDDLFVPYEYLLVSQMRVNGGLFISFF